MMANWLIFQSISCQKLEKLQKIDNVVVYPFITFKLINTKMCIEKDNEPIIGVYKTFYKKP